ncbi:putative acetyltransferase [Soonwooa buanensis]|uniref:Putative acetyltransferase n=1 Tax=Soonwooa buanensis TaxID=619805 RepID=A0A1T5ESY0_9FLAO|nr:GNAT family N-acetyltransferase [Soonwooa buanensis]SKB87053.1 putative acetyltransferase [Soonwooa buanensis]
MYNIKQATLHDYPRIMEIWESAVLATHDFLKKKDFELFKQLIPSEFLPQLQVFVLEQNKQIDAFFSVSDDNLEMLFVHDEARGKGLGTQAVTYVVEILKILKVDVNEQNPRAIGFYEKVGYKKVGRSQVDGMGKPYPLVHFEFQKV